MIRCFSDMAKRISKTRSKTYTACHITVPPLRQESIVPELDFYHMIAWKVIGNCVIQ